MQKRRFTTKKLVLSALFVTLTILMSKFLKIKIATGLVFSFGGYPLMFGGMVLGPYYGFMMGIVSDVIKFMLSPSQFGFNFAFTLLEGLLGWFPGFMVWKLTNGEGFSALLENRKKQNIAIISISLFRAIFINIICNSALLHIYMGKALIALMTARILKNTIEIFLVYFILTAIVEALKARKVKFEF